MSLTGKISNSESHICIWLLWFSVFCLELFFNLFLTFNFLKFLRKRPVILLHNPQFSFGHSSCLDSGYASLAEVLTELMLRSSHWVLAGGTWFQFHDTHFDHLIKVMSANHLHCEVFGRGGGTLRNFVPQQSFNFYIHLLYQHGLPQWLRDKEFACQFRGRQRHGFDPWVRKIPWRRNWLYAPVFLPG